MTHCVSLMVIFIIERLFTICSAKVKEAFKTVKSSSFSLDKVTVESKRTDQSVPHQSPRCALQGVWRRRDCQLRWNGACPILGNSKGGCGQYLSPRCLWWCVCHSWRESTWQRMHFTDTAHGWVVRCGWRLLYSSFMYNDHQRYKIMVGLTLISFTRGGEVLSPWNISGRSTPGVWVSKQKMRKYPPGY